MSDQQDAGEARRHLERLREARRAAREQLDELDAERRVLLRDLLQRGYSRTTLAEWEGVSAWAVSQAARKGSPSEPVRAATLGR